MSGLFYFIVKHRLLPYGVGQTRQKASHCHPWRLRLMATFHPASGNGAGACRWSFVCLERSCAEEYGSWGLREKNIMLLEGYIGAGSSHDLLAE